MNFTALNASQNIKLSDAREFVRKLRALGFTIGNIHANAQASASEANIVDIAELALEEDGKYDLVIRGTRDWHNLALLRLMFGGGTLVEFQRLAQDLEPYKESNVLNIPGAAKAIENLIKKA